MNYKKQPVYLNLLQIKLPLVAIISIMHRISGLLLFLLLPLGLWLYHISLNAAGFNALHGVIQQPLYRIALFLLLASLAYHLLAGLRHLVLDFILGESRFVARVSAGMLIFLTVIVVCFLGVGLWSPM